MLLVTVHRRENFGRPLEQICHALSEVITAFEDLEILWPIHPNPNVSSIVRRQLGAVPRVHLIEPLSYAQFVVAMRRSYLILTYLGGIQEEAPHFTTADLRFPKTKRSVAKL